MSTIFNRLQFVHHDEVFATREEAYQYVINKQAIERPTLVAEPMVLLYESGDDVKGPNVILAIGSVGEGEISTGNRTFFIDLGKTEQEINELGDSFADAIQSLAFLPLETQTAKVNADRTESGTNLSVDVKLAPYKIIDREVKDNIIQTLDDGLYAFLGIDFDEASGKLKFTVNDNVTEYNLPTTKNVVGGEYDPITESIVLNLADGDTVSLPVGLLLAEWRTLDAESTTPVILTRRAVNAEEMAHGMYNWQDVLEGDIRVASHIPDNIAQKDATGRYLYVKGSAENIKYKDGTVKDALDKADIGLSTSVNNIIYARPDGLYATAQLDYNAANNTLLFKYSDGENGETVTKEIKLNSLDIFEDVTYDSTKEAIIIRYQHEGGDYKIVEIPVGELISEWDVQNDSHTVLLYKNRNIEGHDTLSADAKISELENNILEEKAHELYVGGFASNIKYDPENSPEDTVKDVLDYALTSAQTLGQMIEYEAAERTNADNQIHGRLNVVDLAYQPETNRLYFTDTYGETKEIQLVNKVSIIDDITYDKNEKDLIIKYKDSETGEYEYVRFGISELFNEWDVKNLPENSAIELTKTTNPGSGENDYDVLTARVLLTNLEDNLVAIVNNGLYVSGRAVIEQIRPYIAELLDPMQEEIDRIETATGLDEDGNYIPFSGTNYMDSATTITEALEALDDAIENIGGSIDLSEFGRIENAVGLDENGNFVPFDGTNYLDETSSITDSIETLDDELKNVNDKVSGLTGGAGLDEDGSYSAKEDACYISAATSLYNADEILDSTVCELRQDLIEDEEVIAAALNDLNTRKLDASAFTLDGYATEEWVYDQNFVQTVVVNGEEVEVVDNRVELEIPMEIPIDDHLDSGSTNPVENRVITQTIYDNELVIAAALNDLNERKLDASAQTGIDIDSELSSASTNPVENRVITNKIHDVELVAAAAINDLNTRVVNVELELGDLLDCGEYTDGDVVIPDYRNKSDVASL